MANPRTRKQFKDYCLRKLGFPVIDINVDDDQVEDRIDDAIQFWQDYHFDGNEKLYFKHQITQEDRDRKYLLVPDRISFVTGIMPFDESGASVNMFDLRYQLRLHDLYDFTSVSYVPYTITMQHLRTLNLLFSGTPQFRFNRHRNRLELDVNWDTDCALGSFVIIECYATTNPDRIDFPGTVSVATGSNTITSNAGTTLDLSFGVGDEAVIDLAGGSQGVRVSRMISNTTMNVAYTFTTTESGLTLYQYGNSDVWNDRWLKRYAPALIKKQWGEHLKKFGNIQMPGGVILNGKEIFDEAVAEIQLLEEELFKLNTLPADWFVG